MTTDTVRHTKGAPAAAGAHIETHIIPGSLKTTDIAALAAAETTVLARRRVFLQDQLDMVKNQQRILGCAAAAHHILERHPDAAEFILAIKDGYPHQLANVLDSAGRILAARRGGDWADTVMAEVREEPAGTLGTLDGVEPEGARLRVNIGSVVNAVTRIVADQDPHDPRLAAATRFVA